MDFAFSDEQQAFAELARKIFAARCSADQLKTLETGGGPRFDRTLWQELAASGLLGIAIPEAFGGAGQGFFELASVIEEVGRHTAPVPLIETLVLGALPIAEFGSEAQKQALLPAVVEGRLILSAALLEPESDPARPDAPLSTLATESKGGWRLQGHKLCVPAGQIAERVLVPARLASGEVAVFVVDTAAPGVRISPLATTSGEPAASLEFADVRVTSAERLGDAARGAQIVAWIRERGTAALCSLALGVCEEALRLTAEYTKSRKQFGQPIASFQAVGQRQADAFVDTEAIRLTSWQAAWRIGAGMPAAAQVAIAKYWASAAGQRIVHTAAHLHGGTGVDRDYPLHRHFLYAKQFELSLGGATHQLLQLGRMIAGDPI